MEHFSGDQEEEEKRKWWNDQTSVATARDHAILSGLLFGYRNGGFDNVSISLQPAKFPRELFHKAMSIQEAVNTIIDKLSVDNEFLASAFEE